MSAKRYDSGKPRYDLIPALAQEEFAKVLTVGAEKYGVDNWRNGMKWSKVLASLERHLYAIKRGEDRDSETQLLHAAHIMSNAAFLTEYFYTFPELDDRFKYVNGSFASTSILENLEEKMKKKMKFLKI